MPPKGAHAADMPLGDAPIALLQLQPVCFYRFASLAPCCLGAGRVQRPSFFDAVPTLSLKPFAWFPHAPGNGAVAYSGRSKNPTGEGCRCTCPPNGLRVRASLSSLRFPASCWPYAGFKCKPQKATPGAYSRMLMGSKCARVGEAECWDSFAGAGVVKVRGYV